MCGKGCQIDSESFDIEWNLPNNLCRIRVEDDAAFFTDGSDFSDGLENTNLVVSRHHGNQNCLVSDCCLQIIEADQTVVINFKVRDGLAGGLEVLACIEDGFVFRDDSDDVITFFGIHFCDALDGQVV